MLATDNGFPARSATAIVVVDVLRNFFNPRWTQQSYSTNVLETQSLGIPFLTVTATDNDSQVASTLCVSITNSGTIEPSGTILCLRL